MTTINEALTPLGDGFRNLYRTGDKYSAADMAKLLSSLEIHNFLDDGQYFDSKVDNANEMSKELRGMDVAKWNEYLLGKTVIFSCDIEWSGFDSNNSDRKRIGYEFQTSAEDGSVHYNGTWFYPTTPSGKKYCATKMKIYDKPIQHVDYGSMYNQINSDATVKITNVKMYIDPLGGVVPANLLANGYGPFLPQADYGANPYDNYAIYPDTKIRMVYGKKYKLVAHTNGEFSNDHQPTVESNRCVLWLANNKLSQIISDSNTSTGTIFTWGWDTDTYWLRVNAYHHGTANHIQAWDVSITEV